jgi:hypothetical protein
VAVLDVFNWEGVSVAPGSTIFTVAPVWTRLDTVGGGLRVAEVQIRRGRSDEFERTDTGTCRVGFNDQDGDVDPTVVDWISRPFAFAVRNPVTDTWHPRFRGGVDDHGYNLSPGKIKGDVVIEAVDALAYFAGFELAPGLAGDPPPAGSEGYVFYEDTAVTGPQIRINQALADADWPSGLSSIFTGNVNLLETVYSPGESLLTVIHDAADAEFPGVANFFVDKHGVVCFHGRLARFTPAAVAATATHWDFNTWTLGTGGAQIRWPFHPSRSARMIRNAAMCYPHALEDGAEFPVEDRVDQVVTDSGSIGVHGTRSWSAENLIVKEGITTGNTGPEECQAFANYIVSNYADSQVRLDQVTIRPVAPTDARASALWAMACEADISDQVTVVMDHPGAGGVNMTGFIEGITERWWPLVKDLDTGYPMFEITYDISPAAYWTTEPELP